MRRALALAWLIVVVSPRPSSAECGPRPERVCVMANQPGPIVLATILEPVDGRDGAAFEWRARVERSFRGDLKGEIVVFAESGDVFSAAHLTPGEKYLFYLAPTLRDGSPGLWASLGCGSSIPLKAAAKGELAFLAQLGGRVADGHIFGEVYRRRPYPQWELPYSNIRVTATNETRTFATRTKSDGTFDISGLPPGAYRLDADLPNHELVEVDEDALELQPHGCLESDLEVQDNTIVRGHITLPAGMRSTLRFVEAFTPDGRAAKDGWVDEHGDYEIHGVPPGDYVIGFAPTEALPRPDAPFLPTYVPGTTDIAQARRVHLAFNSPVTGVDMTIASVVPKEDVVVRARAGDQPIAQSSFTLLVRGGELRPEATPNPDGTFSLPVVAGTETYVTGESGKLCATPVLLKAPVGPVTLEYSEDGCRRVRNLRHMLAMEASGGAFMTLPIHVSLPDGRPASGARVGLSTSPGSFEADGDGRLELRVPLHERFTLDARPYSSRGPCKANKLVNTSGPPTGGIELALQGSGC